MSYLSFSFYSMAAVLAALYYRIPLRHRWMVLLAGSLLFYQQVSGRGIFLILAVILISYGEARLLGSGRISGRSGRRVCLAVSVLTAVLPWLVFRQGGMCSLFTAVGISFYTVQILAYLADVYRGTVLPQKNPAKYALFVLFFPTIVQGPVSRYGQMQEQLYQGHTFRWENLSNGFYQILWGFFLKFLIADKAAVAVNALFSEPAQYHGISVLAAVCSYSFELYADFLACVSISRGVAALFGIRLADNFRRPYLAVSISDFWRRWHISFSSWLRDYIYIPLGGSRRGKRRKYGNLLITFLVSGIWHGSSLTFLFWGLLHGAYQIVGDLTANLRTKGRNESSESRAVRFRKRICTFALVTFGWIFFRADSMETAGAVLQNLFQGAFFNASFLELGLPWQEWLVLGVAILLLAGVSLAQEKGISVTERIMSRSVGTRWAVTAAAVVAILIFGTYGVGYDAGSFIYGRF